MATLQQKREETDTVSWINVWWQQVSATAAQGVQITIIGMSLVFLTLGLIILALVLLTRLPVLGTETEKQEQQAEQVKQDLSSQPTVERRAASSPTPNDAELARVAAIAVALARSQRPTRGQTRIQMSASKWKQYGRAHQLGL